MQRLVVVEYSFHKRGLSTGPSVVHHIKYRADAKRPYGSSGDFLLFAGITHLLFLFNVQITPVKQGGETRLADDVHA